jgi:hypothetical protein
LNCSKESISTTRKLFMRAHCFLLTSQAPPNLSLSF